MKIENPDRGQGELVLAANSLGLAQDIPQRSLDIVRMADLVVFEEPRVARQVLKAAGVHREFLRLTEHTEEATKKAVTDALAQGQSVCYMSDQGVPTFADPGRDLIDIALKCQAKVRVIPGPSSITTALAACPFDLSRFYFLGFLPREPDERLAKLRSARLQDCPVIILDTPYRFAAVLSAVSAVYGQDHRASVAADISAPEEQFTTDSIGAITRWAENRKINFVLILDAAKQL